VPAVVLLLLVLPEVVVELAVLLLVLPEVVLLAVVAAVVDAVGVVGLPPPQ
jgi:hypothetical protein